jgi:nucleotide-binding universal stress UspA family protein
MTSSKWASLGRARTAVTWARGTDNVLRRARTLSQPRIRTIKSRRVISIETMVPRGVHDTGRRFPCDLGRGAWRFVAPRASAPQEVGRTLASFERMKSISKILVPIDFSPASLKALDDAIDLASRLDASIVVMHAYESAMVTFPESAMTMSADTAKRRASIDAAMRGVVELRENRGVPLEYVVREGTPWREIDVVAEDKGADLIVLGRHGRHGLLHALLTGSVSAKVAQQAHRPVLTIQDEITDA